MVLITLLVTIPFLGIIIVLSMISYDLGKDYRLLKSTALFITIIELLLSLAIWILFDNSSKYIQFVQEKHSIGYYDLYLGLDGISIYFVLLTTLIVPISIISNWKSIGNNVIYFLLILLLLEALLLIIFVVLDIIMFYIFFESILAPLFILIGLFGSKERLRASFYFFLYTFLGSLFMLLSLISMLSSMGCTDFNILSKGSFFFTAQVFMFIGIFIAFAIKTPVIYLNGWLLKAHVESPLSGSIILAAIVLKLSLYGIFRLILPLVPKAFMYYTFTVLLIGVLTIIYASLSTLRTIDVKELIAYSSVSHAAVYLSGVFSNTLQGIQGGILLGLAHGFVSSGLFTSAGGVLYDRSGTRLISYYRGIAQVMPIFAIFFFMLSLGNCGAPLTINFVGEFMSLYGIFERLPLAGILACSSIVFSAAFTMFMFNRICFAGSYYFKYWLEYMPDINSREFFILLSLVLFTIILGIYPSIILDGLNYSVSSLIFNVYYEAEPTNSLLLSLEAFSSCSIFVVASTTTAATLLLTIFFAYHMRKPAYFVFVRLYGFLTREKVKMAILKAMLSALFIVFIRFVVVPYFQLNLGILSISYMYSACIVLYNELIKELLSGYQLMEGPANSGISKNYDRLKLKGLDFTKFMMTSSGENPSNTGAAAFNNAVNVSYSGAGTPNQPQNAISTQVIRPNAFPTSSSTQQTYSVNHPTQNAVPNQEFRPTTLPHPSTTQLTPGVNNPTRLAGRAIPWTPSQVNPNPMIPCTFNVGTRQIIEAPRPPRPFRFLDAAVVNPDNKQLDSKNFPNYTSEEIDTMAFTKVNGIYTVKNFESIDPEGYVKDNNKSYQPFALHLSRALSHINRNTACKTGELFDGIPQQYLSFIRQVQAAHNCSKYNTMKLRKILSNL